MLYKLTIEKFEEEKTVLKTEDNITVVWPKNKIPKDAKVGDSLMFNVSMLEGEELEKKQLAKDIINEILDTDS